MNHDYSKVAYSRLTPIDSPIEVLLQCRFSTAKNIKEHVQSTDLLCSIVTCTQDLLLTGVTERYRKRLINLDNERN